MGGDDVTLVQSPLNMSCLSGHPNSILTRCTDLFQLDKLFFPIISTGGCAPALLAAGNHADDPVQTS